MPRKKADDLGKTAKTIKKEAEKVEVLKESEQRGICCLTKPCGKKFLSAVVVLLILLAAAGYFFRDKYLAAIVNNRPIFRYQLNESLTKSFGKEALENLIVEKLIKDEVKKKQIVVNEGEIDKEAEKISRTLTGGMKLEDALKAQGMSLADFRNQLKLRLQINGILGKDIVISNEEIDKFIKDNGKAMAATSEAEKRIEATEALKNQQLGAKIQSWISDLLKQAKIVRYIK